MSPENGQHKVNASGKEYVIDKSSICTEPHKAKTPCTETINDTYNCKGNHVERSNKTLKYLSAGIFCVFAFSAASCTSQNAGQQNGEAEFKKHCAVCHLDGGNIITPAKSLSKKDREKNGIKTVEDIVKLMRKPGEGMTGFDENSLPEKTADNIGKYIIDTFR